MSRKEATKREAAPAADKARVIAGGGKDDQALANELIMKYGLQRLLYPKR
ncbi:MAG TPA: hypothetical protein VKB93_15300 [Thermoanaerobaculia bacterium]|nr:hypothetical protein [Thermoanaerobaculia bacterium]